MPSLKNENILSTLISSFSMKEATHFVKQVNNATLNKLLLRYINYEKIFKSLKTAQVILQKCGRIKNSIALLHNGNMVSFNRYEIKIFNTTKFECIKTLQDDQPITSGIILPNGDILTCNSNRLKIWEVNNDFKCTKKNTIHCIAIFDKNFNLIKDFTLMIDTVWCQDFANINNNRFVYASNDGLDVCNLDDYKCFQAKTEEDYIIALLFIKRNNLLLSSSINNTYLKVWNTNNFHCIKIIQMTKPVSKFLSLPCGFIVCGFVNYPFDINLEIWNIDKGECINSFKGYRTITSLIFKDNRIISKSEEGIG
jgi:WD40 repeat protein